MSLKDLSKAFKKLELAIADIGAYRMLYKDLRVDLYRA